MGESGYLTPFQIRIANAFFELDASAGYLVAGGAALLATDLIARPTEDLDLFASSPVTSVTHAKNAFVQSLRDRGYSVSLIQEWPTFCRIIVEAEGNKVLVDLAIDAPPRSHPTVTILGPTMSPKELVGRKLLALFGRAEARDFADTFVLVRHFGKDVLLEHAAALDPGFDTTVLAEMMATLGRFSDDEVPLNTSDLVLAKEFFTSWADELR